MPVGNTEVTSQLGPCGNEEHVPCGIRDTLDRLGDKWTVMVMAELVPGVRRFREIERGIAGISQRMLTRTLRRLERDGMVVRTVYPTVPPQVTYELTAQGESFSHLVAHVADWSRDHMDVVASARQRYDATNPAALAS